MKLIACAVTTIALTLCVSAGTNAAEVKLLSSAAIKPAVDALTSPFESATKNKLLAKFVLTPEVPKMIDGGEVFDVAIANPPHIDALIKSGKIAPGSRAEVARFGLGVGVRSGAPKPNVGSVQGFKQALLDAKTVAYVGAGTSGTFFVGALERPGITKDMEGKLKPGGIAENNAAVAKGEVDIVVMPVPLILAGSGVELAGAVPTEYQDHIVLVAGLAANAPEAKAGQDLIKLLLSAEAETVLKAKGYERIVK